MHKTLIPLHQKLNNKRKDMELFEFLFLSGLLNSQEEEHRNERNSIFSDHDNYDRDYEDGYCDSSYDHDSSYDDCNDSGY